MAMGCCAVGRREDELELALGPDGECGLVAGGEEVGEDDEGVGEAVGVRGQGSEEGGDDACGWGVWSGAAGVLACPGPDSQAARERQEGRDGESGVGHVGSLRRAQGTGWLGRSMRRDSGVGRTLVEARAGLRGGERRVRWRVRSGGVSWSIRRTASGFVRRSICSAAEGAEAVDAVVSRDDAGVRMSRSSVLV